MCPSCPQSQEAGWKKGIINNPKVSKCLGFRQLGWWFFSGCTNVPAFTGLVPRPTKLFYDVFPALSGPGSGMLSPGGNLELRALHDQG